jgi:hypothetical protein
MLTEVIPGSRVTYDLNFHLYPLPNLPNVTQSGYIIIMMKKTRTYLESICHHIVEHKTHAKVKCFGHPHLLVD